MASGSRFTGSASPLAILGAGAFWLWLDAGVFSGTLTGLGGSSEGYLRAFLIVTFVSVASIAVCGLGFGGDLFSSRRKAAVTAGGVIATAGSALLFASEAFLDGALVVEIAGALLMGLAFGALTAAWGHLCVAQGHTKAVLHVAAAWALSLPCNVGLAMLPQMAAGTIVCALPVVSAAIYLVLSPLQQAEPYRIEPYRRDDVAAVEGRGFVAGVDARFLALVLVFAVMFGLMYFYRVLSPSVVSADGAIQVVSARGLMAAAILVAALTVLRDRMEPLFRASLFVFVAGMFAMIASYTAPALESPSGTLVAMGYCGYDVLVWALVAYHSYVSVNLPPKTVGLAIGTQQLGIALGATVGNAMVGLGLDRAGEVTVVALLGLLAVGAFMLFTEYGSRMWALLVRRSLDAEVIADERDAVAAVMREYGLSEREGEVLALFSQGRSMGYIAEKLYVSENTVKTHVRHIYTKCGVRGKQELIDLVDSRSSKVETTAKDSVANA